jgi:hypothetical protein
MKKNTFELGLFFTYIFFSTTALLCIVTCCFFSTLTLKKHNLNVGPVVTLYQTFGNATTGKTEVPPYKPNHEAFDSAIQPAVSQTNCQVLANGQ